MDFFLSTKENEAYFPFGLTISDTAEVQFDIDGLLRQCDADEAGNQVRFARALADAVNAQPHTGVTDARPARAGELLALMLLHEIYRHVISLYAINKYPDVFNRGISHLREHLGARTADQVLSAYIAYYPPRKDRLVKVSPEEYLAGSVGAYANVERALWEMAITQIDHENPALASYKPLFDNAELNKQVPLTPFMQTLDTWLLQQPPFPETTLSLLEMLREPMRQHPDSLESQLEYVMRRWRRLLPAGLLDRWLVMRGVIAEETAFRGMGPGPYHAPMFGGEDYAEPEAFSRDEDWMPKVVLLAKLAYVWLDQLSRKYGRRLTLLSDIPDEELDRLARWGFKGLWLIGVWERSSASEKIKQRMGNIEAAASAYSLYDYVIARDLGGEAALQNLAYRCGLRGIRLAGDMVPNHMGIYSKWVVENPERFVQLNHPPFPGYRFNGPDLSDDGRVSLHIEEGYWTHSDASVVFKRTDKQTGDSVYIYHGNDGTSMPWNDTAQLNFLREDTREAVIQTIIQVARRFPIIRFDAAMTLAKKHYQRLWFPKPGEGGAIPSRATFGMNRTDFDRVFPKEFWREVVDRIAAEAPDTLLLAEAFWLMEGYFVRTLGMHRVYNSAFMNMLKMEENSKYRQTIKNILEFSPEILQRFVNFMNNPDEDTAEAQFGKGDKYFGVAVLLATMPGLPMFGHGQIEGFTEKYGMEYRRAYRDEEPDPVLIERHEQDIFPLMRKRYLFSGALNFALYDLVTPDGWVDENVFAYSNRCGEEHALVVYNNAYNATCGVLHTSTAINVGRGDDKILERRSLAQALGLDTAPHSYVVWRDEHTKLEYLHHCATISEKGLHLELHAYGYNTFVFVRHIHDTDQSWGRLHAELGGIGVSSIQEAYLEMHLAGILEPFRELMSPEMLRRLLTHDDAADPLGPWQEKLTAFLKAVNAHLDRPDDGVEDILTRVAQDLRLCRETMKKPLYSGAPEPIRRYVQANTPGASALTEKTSTFWRVPLVYCLLRSTGGQAALSQDGIPSDKVPGDTVLHRQDRPTAEQLTALRMNEWLLIKPVAAMFEGLDGDTWRAWRDARLVTVCLAHRARLLDLEHEIWAPVLHALFEDADTRAVLQVNVYNQTRWVNKEQLEFSLFMLFLINLMMLKPALPDQQDRLAACYEHVEAILQTASDTGYNFDWMLNALK